MKDTKRDMAWTISSILDECLYTDTVDRDKIVGQIMGRQIDGVSDEEISDLIEVYDTIMSKNKEEK